MDPVHPAGNAMPGCCIPGGINTTLSTALTGRLVRAQARQASRRQTLGPQLEHSDKLGRVCVYVSRYPYHYHYGVQVTQNAALFFLARTQLSVSVERRCHLSTSLGVPEARRGYDCSWRGNVRCGVVW